ncbi:hypothetical protein [Vibrio sp. 10N]|uniref:hypothetical protein n=1 Tax=Vibrio sp. 10N TaxID=3058938 RepID=UPI0028142DD4|nr:hypothetical protein VB10N_47050 [Vibrio sp. 10N]
MKSEITEAIQENIVLWLAYAKLEKITYSEAEQRIEAYYLGLQEVLDINQLSTILPYFSDARAYITATTGQAPSSLFFTMGHQGEAEEMLAAKGEVIEDLDKNLQLNARRFKAEV